MSSHEAVLKTFSEITAMLKLEREYSIHVEGNYTSSDVITLKRRIRVVIYDISLTTMLIRLRKYSCYATAESISSYLELISTTLTTSLIKLDKVSSLSGDEIDDIMEYDYIFYNINQIWRLLIWN